MSRDWSTPPGDLNPYAAPNSPSIEGRSIVSGTAPRPGSTFEIRHNLTDRDLKRFLECDFFYDPKPVFGIFPQWIFLMGIIALMGGVATWLKTESAPFACAAALLLPILFGVLMVAAAAANRSHARSGGFLEGRRITIAAEGLRVDYPAATGLEQAELSRRQARTMAQQPALRNSGLAAAFYTWNDFRAVEFFRGDLILWQQGRRRLVIPVQAFETVDAAETFAKAAAGWISG